MFSAETQNTRGYAFTFAKTGKLDGLFLSALTPGQHIYTGAHADTGHQSSREGSEPLFPYGIPQPLGFTAQVQQGAPAAASHLEWGR